MFRQQAASEVAANTEALTAIAEVNLTVAESVSHSATNLASYAADLAETAKHFKIS